MSHKGKNAKSNFISLFVGTIIVFSLLTSLSEQGTLSFNIPTWDDIFNRTGLSSISADTNNHLTVHYIDVGQGDSILIKAPDGCILIDGGDNGYGETVISYLNNLDIKTLDYVIATHPHSDHIGGLDEVIDTLEVKNVIMPRLTSINIPTTKCYECFLESVHNSDAKVIAAKQGDSYELGKAYMLILSPVTQSENLNDMSVVTRISYGDTYFLFMGDTESSVESELVDSEYSEYLKADVLKAGHHGSNTSSRTEFMNKVQPLSIVISCGMDNNFGHPHREALKRMKKTGANILRTDLNGTIVIGSDGKSLSISTEKE